MGLWLMPCLISASPGGKRGGGAPQGGTVWLPAWWPKGWCWPPPLGTTRWSRGPAPPVGFWYGFLGLEEGR